MQKTKNKQNRNAACGGKCSDTEEGNGQKLLMVDLEDKDEMYRDIFRLIEIRRG